MDRKKALAIGIALVAGFGTANAHDSRYSTARVTAVEPVYATVVVETPVRRCHNEIVERRVTSPTVAGQTLAGAIVGAAIGRQFGDGRGRDALTVLGAMAGSAVANNRALRREAESGASPVTIVREPVERCTTEYRRHAERRITGYWVEYRHRGRHYRILSHERPGAEIRIAVRP
jgi:uncharacterized protein YcfJ